MKLYTAVLSDSDHSKISKKKTELKADLEYVELTHYYSKK